MAHQYLSLYLLLLLLPILLLLLSFFVFFFPLISCNLTPRQRKLVSVCMSAKCVIKMSILCARIGRYSKPQVSVGLGTDKVRWVLSSELNEPGVFGYLRCSAAVVYLSGVEQVSHHVSCQTRAVSGDHLSLQLHQQPFCRPAAIHAASAGAHTHTHARTHTGSTYIYIYISIVGWSSPYH